MGAACPDCRRGFLLAGFALGGFLLCGVFAARAGQPAREWQPAVRDYPWSFPRDHWAHDRSRTEWWYFVGVLETRHGRELAWQFTLFRTGLIATPTPEAASPWAARHALMGHAVVADLDSGERVFSQVVHREAPGLGAAGRFPEPEILAVAGPAGTASDWSLRLEDGTFRLRAADRGAEMAIRLTLTPTRPPVFHGEAGYSEKSPGGGASNYYSLTRMEAAGELTLGGVTGTGRGWGWMDREFGAGWLAPDQTGWDWFALSLDDGRDLMLYLLRREDGSLSHADGTLLEADHTALRVPGARVEVTDTWTPPRRIARNDEAARPYPAGWRIEIPAAGARHSMVLQVRPLLADQENRRGPDQTGPDIPYWEGAVEVLPGSPGSPAGVGFVELTGYRRPMTLRALGGW